MEVKEMSGQEATLSELIARWAEKSNQSRGALYRAAALKSTFDPQTLKPVDGSDQVSAPDRIKLLKDSKPYRLQPDLRILDDDVRRLELRCYQDIERLRSDFAKVNQDDDPRDYVQKMFRHYLFGTAKPLETQDYDELSGTVAVLDWFRGTEAAERLGLPTLEEALGQMGWRSILKLLKNIQGETFTNREYEQRKLKDYTHHKSAPPFTIRGIGGIGKSALIAAFLHKELETASEGHRPLIVWLDFARNQVFDAADNPYFLLEIITSELFKQLPQNRTDLENFRRFLESDRSICNIQQYDVRLRIQQLAQILLASQQSTRPLYIVMDTLEELQYKDWQTVQDIYKFSEALRERIPSLKTFMVARLLIEKEIVDEFALELQDLDPESALKLLENMGVPSQYAERIINAFPCHPLRLKVAAQVFKKAHEEGRLNSEAEEISLIDEIIQAQSLEMLVFRYLKHIRHEEVRKLISPGMALRKISPELIYEVLKDPCNLSLSSPAEAEALFNELKKELYLVEETKEPSELRFRPSIRRHLYSYLKTAPEDRKRLSDIHRKAIEFYRQRDLNSERAEEIYYRLASGQSRKTIDKRWENGVENYLVSALGDPLPLTSLAYLANKLGLEAPILIGSNYWDQAQQIMWEVRAERNAARQLKLDKPEEALRIIAEREGWTQDSPLYLLKAKALRRQKKLSEARQVIRDALYARQDQRSRSALELWFLLFWLEVEEGRKDEADRALSVIQSRIGEGRNLEEKLEVAVRQLVSLRINGRNSGKVYQSWADKAAKTLEEALSSPSRTERPHAQKNPKLARRLVAEIALYQHIDLLRRVLGELGIGDYLPAKALALANSLVQWQIKQPKVPLAKSAGLIVPPKNQPGDISQIWSHWLLYEDGLKVGQGLAKILGSEFAPPAEVVQDVVELLRFSDEAPREPGVEERRSQIHASENRRRKTVDELQRRFGSKPDELAQFLRSNFGMDLAQITTAPLREERLAPDVAKWAEVYGLSEQLQQMLKR